MIGQAGEEVIERVDPKAECALLKHAAEAKAAKAEALTPSKGERLRKRVPFGSDRAITWRPEPGVTLRGMTDEKGCFIRIEGPRVDEEMRDWVFEEMTRVFRSRWASLKSRRLGQVDPEAVAVPLVAARHFGRRVAELFLDWCSSISAELARPAVTVP